MTGFSVVRDQSVTWVSCCEGSVSDWFSVVSDQSVIGISLSEGSVSDWDLLLSVTGDSCSEGSVNDWASGSAGSVSD